MAADATTLESPEQFRSSLCALSAVPRTTAVTEDSRLSELGIASLSFLSWFYALEDEYGVSLGEEALFEAFGETVTVGGLRRRLLAIVARASGSPAARGA